MRDDVEKFVDDLAERDFLVFAGAGTSGVTGVKKWRELLVELNGLVRLRGVNISEVDDLHFPEVAQMIFNVLERSGQTKFYYEGIKQCMQPTQCLWTSVHTKIIRASSSIVTTNIDSIFENALADELKNKGTGVGGKREVAYQTLSKLDAGEVMKSYHVTYLHGRYDEEEIVLKTCDYFKWYRALNGGSESDLEEVLREIFCRREAIVFVGFSFGDRFVLETFERGFREMEKSLADLRKGAGVVPKEVKHYALMDDPVAGGVDREVWLRENRNNIVRGSVDEKEAIEVERRDELETRLRKINVEVIRYGHEKHVQVDAYFEAIRNKRLGVQDFVRIDE